MTRYTNYLIYYVHNKNVRDFKFSHLNVWQIFHKCLTNIFSECFHCQMFVKTSNVCKIFIKCLCQIFAKPLIQTFGKCLCQIFAKPLIQTFGKCFYQIFAKPLIQTFGKCLKHLLYIWKENVSYILLWITMFP